MSFLISFIVSVVRLAIWCLQILMLVRAVMSWLPFDDDTPLQRFLYCTTEPVITPVRKILEKSDWISGLPIDLSFLFAYLILNIITILLPAVEF